MPNANWDRSGRARIRLPFIGNPHMRGSNSAYDQRFLNCFFDPITDAVTKHLDYYLIKRPGMIQVIQPSGGAGVARGFYVWPLTNKVYSVYGNQIYINSTNTGVTLTTSTGMCGFAETRPGCATPYLCINDGVKLYIINTSGTVTTITTNFPTPNTTDLEYMDTYIFALDFAGNLWNCAADDPTTWSNSQLITDQMMAGPTTACARQANYMLVFQDRSCQMYYDAANVGGSPLSNVDQAMFKIGCDSQQSVSHLEDSVFWVGNSASGGYTVWKLEGASGLSEIGISPINRLLDLEGSNLSKVSGIVFRVGGHKFYAITLITANRTFVWQDTVGMWIEWADYTGNNPFPIVASSESGNNRTLVQHATNGWIYQFDTSVYQDDTGNNIYVLARFGRNDFDTIARKYCNSVDLIYDRQSSQTYAYLSYSDDDYQTFSTPRQYDMSQTRGFGRAFGNFRRRSWQITHQDNTPLRLEGIELDLQIDHES